MRRYRHMMRRPFHFILGFIFLIIAIKITFKIAKLVLIVGIIALIINAFSRK